MPVISIHTLRVEGDKIHPWRGILDRISIHTLRVEGDDTTEYERIQSCISIHTLRVEGDPPSGWNCPKTGDFNPHPPRGG